MNPLRRFVSLGLLAFSPLLACGEDAADPGPAPGPKGGSGNAAGSAGRGGTGGRAGQAGQSGQFAGGAAGGNSSGGKSGGAGADTTNTGGSLGMSGQTAAGTAGSSGVAGTTSSAGGAAGTAGITGAAGEGAAGSAGKGAVGGKAGSSGNGEGAGATSSSGSGGGGFGAGGSGTGGFGAGGFGAGGSSAGGFGAGGSGAGGFGAGGFGAGGFGAGGSGAGGFGAGGFGAGGFGAGGSGPAGTGGGGGSSGGGSGGSGTIQPGFDLCSPSKTLQDGVPLADSLTSATLPLAFACSDGSTKPYVLYTYAPPTSGVVDFLFTDTGKGLYARAAINEGCGSPGSHVSLCPRDVYHGSKLTVPATAGVPLTLALHASDKDGGDGTFTVEANARKVICGDTLLDPGEQCDPPNGTDCSKECQLQEPPCGDGIVTYPETCDPPGGVCGSSCHYDSCPDVIVLPPSGGAALADFKGKTNVLEKSCGTSSKTGQVTYQITPSVTGVLEIDTDSPVTVALFPACTAAVDPLSCSFTKGSGLRQAVTKNVPVFVVLTGALSEKVALATNNRAIVCGDSKLDPGEGCDPPGVVCSPQCQPKDPPCGDGIVTSPEQCDPPTMASCDDKCRYVGCPQITTLANDVAVDVDLKNRPYFSESCVSSGSQAAFAYTPLVTGPVALRLAGADNFVTVAVESTCGDPAAGLACEQAKLSTTGSILSFPGTAGVPLFFTLTLGDKGSTQVNVKATQAP